MTSDLRTRLVSTAPTALARRILLSWRSDATAEERRLATVLLLEALIAEREE